MKPSVDRQKRALAELLAKPGNNTCADCHSSAPRWASWNLGIFLCVQCATAHRKLGSHISKVKSVTLDTWTKEQVESMKSLGNIKANALYNPDPLRNPPPTRMDDSERDSELEIYIRNKYQYKAFMKRDRETPRTPVDRPSSILTSRASPGPGSYRGVIEAVSPSASSLMADMESHTRAQLSRTSAERMRDRARSTPPTESGSRPVFGARIDGKKDTSGDMAFTSVGVTPSGSSRPSTATARLGTVPAITTTPPSTTKPRAATGGGFSWASTKPVAPDPIPKTASPPTIASASVSSAPAAPKPPVQAPQAPVPEPKPEKQLSLYEQDLMSLQLGPPAQVQPPSSFNPFPQSGSVNPYTSSSSFMNGNPGMGAFSGGPNPNGGVQSLTTGMSSMSMSNGVGTGTPNGYNPFSAMQASSQQFSSASPFPATMQQQPTGFGGGLSSQNPFGFQQQSNSFQPSSSSQFQSPFQPSSSPFQPQTNPFPTQQSAYQSSPSPAPFQPSPSPFQANNGAFQPTSQFQPQSTGFQSSPSPFQQQQQPQYTGAFGQQPQQTNNFASFAQGMLPQQQGVQPTNQFNPFARQQTGMGVNGWMN